MMSCLRQNRRKRNNQIRICGEDLNENAVIYVHGKGGNAEEANRYKQFLMTALKSLDLIANHWTRGMLKSSV